MIVASFITALHVFVFMFFLRKYVVYQYQYVIFVSSDICEYSYLPDMNNNNEQQVKNIYEFSGNFHSFFSQNYSACNKGWQEKNVMFMLMTAYII